MARFTSRTFKKHVSKKSKKSRKSRKSKRQRGGGNTFNRSISPQAVRANPLNLDDYKGDNAIDTKT